MISASKSLTERLNEVRQNIRQACDGVGRDSSTLELLAISKYQGEDAIRELVSAGQNAFGENYAQELSQKRLALSDLSEITWHFTGHLQSNKAGLAVGKVSLIQSVDSSKIAIRVSNLATARNITQNVLVEVNLGDEPEKTGIGFDRAEALCTEIARLPGIALKGLMGVAPQQVSGGACEPRFYFAKLKRLFDRLPAEHMQVLSMGMSSDYVSAIAEGSTMVRIGTALFGSRLKAT